MKSPRACALLALGSLALAAPACLQIGPSAADAGADAPADGASDTGADALDATVVCTGEQGTDSVSGFTFCRSISRCPGLVVDRDVFPNCGFRLSNTAIELLCLCDGAYYCPIGTSLTCAQAKDLLATQSELGVCMQMLEGRCARRDGVGRDL